MYFKNEPIAINSKFDSSSIKNHKALFDT